jgi:hypothetical protein
VVIVQTETYKDYLAQLIFSLTLPKALVKLKTVKNIKAHAAA